MNQTPEVRIKLNLSSTKLTSRTLQIPKKEPPTVATANPLMISLLQYNARSLTKANLIMFKACLHQYKPLMILLSETFRKNSFSVKFKQFHTINKNRENHPGGEVAILIHKSLQFVYLTIATLQTIEAVAISVSIE